MTAALIETEEPRPGIVVIRLNRADALNAMNAELIKGLHDALAEIRDDSHVRVAVLTGAGRAFCAGLDLRGYGTPPGTPRDGEGRPQAGLRVQQHIADLGDAFRRVRAPIVAAVNGAAAGAGWRSPCSATSGSWLRRLSSMPRSSGVGSATVTSA